MSKDEKEVWNNDEKDSFFSAFILGSRGVCHLAVPTDVRVVVRIAEQEMDKVARFDGPP
jgi:hypothetical protein